jgi:hypothetical protein
MTYCIEERGMDQPLTIQPHQVASNPALDQTTPADYINPTTTTPGLNFTSMNPQINVTLIQRAALTLIYLPTNLPNQPTNVLQFGVQFTYPNGTISEEFQSAIPSANGTITTIPSTPAPSETTTTTSTPSGVVPPSDDSPQVDLPANFHVPNSTVVTINIKSTIDNLNASGVCIISMNLISR